LKHVIRVCVKKPNEIAIKSVTLGEESLSMKRMKNHYDDGERFEVRYSKFMTPDQKILFKRKVVSKVLSDKEIEKIFNNKILD